MPHSSGGGSSYGGSHGSSGSSSHDSGGGYRSSYGGFDSGSGGGSCAKYFIALFALVWTVMGFSELVKLIIPPQKIMTDYDTAIVIRDNADVLDPDEEAAMADAFRDFQDKTGVTPAFYSIYDSDRQNTALEKYAYDLYVKTFNDEKHWLIVYNSIDNENYWEWEGMIGVDCGSIITTDLENRLTERLQDNLKSDPKKISASVIDAFETVGNNARKVSFRNFLRKGGRLGLATLAGAFVLWVIFRFF